MNALFLIGLTQQVLTKRFRVAWDTGAMAVVYVGCRVARVSDASVGER